MSGYIKREDAIKSIQKHDLANDCNGSKEWAEWLLEDVKPADVVEVVRCKDCKFYNPISERIGECKDTRMNTTYMSYCSYGERKDDE